MKTEGSEQLIVSFNPFRCRMWRLHDRNQECITEDSCREEISSVQRHGQMVPVLGRQLRDDPEHDVELIFGARRLFVARNLNVPIRVELRTLTDREAIVAMDLENRQRLDVSPHERGTSYLNWIRQGVFGSQEDIAAALRISASRVSRLIKVARLPPVILAAFENPNQICEGWGLEIAAALQEPGRREYICRRAREIAARKSRPSAGEVCRDLLSASNTGRKPKPVARNRDQVVLSDDGAPLFRVRRSRNTVMLLLPVQSVSARVLNQIHGVLRSVLQREGTANVDVPCAALDEGSKFTASKSGEATLLAGRSRDISGGEVG